MLSNINIIFIWHLVTALKSSINPFQILQCSNGELLFFIVNNNSNNVYSIDGEIQVSVGDNIISSMNIDLFNFPIPSILQQHLNSHSKMILILNSLFLILKDKELKP